MNPLRTEQLTGTSADVRADVYAAGALLYEMVTGAPPHAASADPIARKLAEPVQSPRMFRPEIPAALEALIMAGLDRDPAARPASMAAFEEVLSSVARAREAEPQNDEAERATPPVSPDRRRARRDAAFRAIGDLLTAQEARPASELLPTIIGAADAPVIESPDSPDRPTPLQAPSAAMVAATAPAESNFEVPTAKDAFTWTPPVPGGSPSSPSVGGAMLERYGEGGAGKTRAIIVVVVALALVGAAAFVLLR